MGSRNWARCRKCGVVVESLYRHDFQTCKCGAISVDGGTAYHRMVGDPNDFVPVPNDWDGEVYRALDGPSNDTRRGAW